MHKTCVNTHEHVQIHVLHTHTERDRERAQSIIGNRGVVRNTKVMNTVPHCYLIGLVSLHGKTFSRWIKSLADAKRADMLSDGLLLGGYFQLTLIC